LRKNITIKINLSVRILILHCPDGVLFQFTILPCLTEQCNGIILENNLNIIEIRDNKWQIHILTLTFRDYISNYLQLHDRMYEESLCANSCYFISFALIYLVFSPVVISVSSLSTCLKFSTNFEFNFRSVEVYSIYLTW
jgi:hypothetical protein